DRIPTLAPGATPSASMAFASRSARSMSSPNVRLVTPSSTAVNGRNDAAARRRRYAVSRAAPRVDDRIYSFHLMMQAYRHMKRPARFEGCEVTERELARRISAIEAGCVVEVAPDAGGPAKQAHIVGVTGPPGSGKSTLVDGLISEIRKRGATVAVL